MTKEKEQIRLVYGEDGGESKQPVGERHKKFWSWRSKNQEEIDDAWKKLAVKIEEEVLEKYKVEVSKRGAF